MSNPILQRIDEMVKANQIFLFMKGSPDFPQCGFSGGAVQILRGVGANFGSFDVLSDSDVRNGAKEYANWPTFPQLYVKGELVGGFDIMREMYQSGELKKLVDEAQG
jgi:monothiol glutaredoxin